MAKPAVHKLILRVIGISLTVDTVIYFVMIWVFRRLDIHRSFFVFKDIFYILEIALSLILVIAVEPVRERIWMSRKAVITSPGAFYQILAATTIISMMIVDLAGILGFVTFLFTGQVFFPCLMLAISFAGKMFYFPWEAQIDRRKAELSFPIEA